MAPAISSMRLAEHLRSTYVRAACAYAALFVISVSLIFAGTFLAIRHEMRRALDESITEDINALFLEYRSGGFPALREAVDERLAENPDNERIYVLEDGDGGTVAGNLWNLPVRAGDYEDAVTYRSAPNSEDPRDELAIVRISRQPDAVLAVGRSTSGMNEALEIIFACFTLGTAVTLALSLLSGLLFGRSVARRIRTMSDTAHAIISGQIARRMPTRTEGDEFDRLSSDINRMLDRIQDLMERVKQISNDIAHDLRSPLARLRQTLESALTAKRGGATAARAAIRQAIGETDTIIDTFNALLRIAEVESGARKSHFKSVDLSSLLRILYEIYRPVSEDSELKLQCKVQDGIIVTGDPELLTQLFANLIENALRHVPAGGSISIRLMMHGASARTIVADDGPGIPASERDRVFQRLYRLEQSRATPGTGLGLSLVTAVVSLHDGAIELAGNDPGLKVTVTLPSLARGASQPAHVLAHRSHGVAYSEPDGNYRRQHSRSHKCCEIDPRD